MTRSGLVLTIVAGLLVFAGILLVYLPAGWFASRLPPGVTCAELAGSVWDGECQELSFHGARLGDVSWDVKLWKALGGRLYGKANLRGPMTLTSDLDLTLKGAGTLSNVRGDIPLDPAVVAGLDPALHGHAKIDLARLTLGDGFALRHAQGTIQAVDISEANLNYGSYEVNFDSPPLADGTFTGRLRNLGGSFRVDGTVTVQPPATLQVVGYVTGLTADAERIVRQNIPFAPDASGRTEFRFETSF